MPSWGHQLHQPFGMAGLLLGPWGDDTYETWPPVHAKYTLVNKVTSRAGETPTFEGGMASQNPDAKKNIKKRFTFLMFFWLSNSEVIKQGPGRIPNAQTIKLLTLNASLCQKTKKTQRFPLLFA